MNNSILSNYEKKHNVKIPESIKFCLNNKIFENLLPTFYDKKENFNFPIVNYLKYDDEKNGELSITELINSENIERYIRSFDNMVNYQQDFFPISFEVFPQSAWLLVGINKENNLQVWITAPGGGDDLKLLSEDLFMFLNKCNQIYNPEIKIKNLYKRYEEPFWRIK
jgi:hypothetical protein